MIEKECITKLYNDIFDGPKYLTPLAEFTVLKFLIYFFIVPEKLLHKFTLEDIKFTSFLVKQLKLPKLIFFPVKIKVINL